VFKGRLRWEAARWLVVVDDFFPEGTDLTIAVGNATVAVTLNVVTDTVLRPSNEASDFLSWTPQFWCLVVSPWFYTVETELTTSLTEVLS